MAENQAKLDLAGPVPGPSRLRRQRLGHRTPTQCSKSARRRSTLLFWRQPAPAPAKDEASATPGLRSGAGTGEKSGVIGDPRAGGRLPCAGPDSFGLIVPPHCTGLSPLAAAEGPREFHPQATGLADRNSPFISAGVAWAWAVRARRPCRARRVGFHDPPLQWPLEPEPLRSNSLALWKSWKSPRPALLRIWSQVCVLSLWRDAQRTC